MYLISGTDVNENYHQAGILLRGIGRWEETRNGRALVAPRPVTTHYHYPAHRVLFDATRDANPFFHLMESLWILAGWEEVAWLAQFNSRISDYSDDGETFHGAYGKRLRQWDGTDQLDMAVKMLKENPNDRRVVLSIWDPSKDLWADSKDIPCNDMLKVDIRGGALNLIVFNRSNDIIWGCYGANVVQFSMIQEYLARRAGAQMGWMEQVSTNWHAYEETWEAKKPYNAPYESPYDRGAVFAYPLMDEGREDKFDADLWNFMEWTCRDLTTFIPQYSNSFFSAIAVPMFLAWKAHKHKERTSAYHILGDSMPQRVDWQVAAMEWLDRRAKA